MKSQHNRIELVTRPAASSQATPHSQDDHQVIAPPTGALKRAISATSSSADFPQNEDSMHVDETTNDSETQAESSQAMELDYDNEASNQSLSRDAPTSVDAGQVAFLCLLISTIAVKAYFCYTIQW